MVEFDVFVKRVDGLADVIAKEANKVLLSQGNEIAEMMKDQHLKGLNRDSEQMQRGYSKGYGARRRKKGLQTGYVDLHFTGNYHSKLKTVPAKEGVDVVSGVEYEKYIRGNFPGMAGLTKQNADAVAEVISDIIAPLIKKYLIA